MHNVICASVKEVSASIQLSDDVLFSWRGSRSRLGNCNMTSSLHISAVLLLLIRKGTCHSASIIISQKSDFLLITEPQKDTVREHKFRAPFLEGPLTYPFLWKTQLLHVSRFKFKSLEVPEPLSHWAEHTQCRRQVIRSVQVYSVFKKGVGICPDFALNFGTSQQHN